MGKRQNAGVPCVSKPKRSNIATRRGFSTSHNLSIGAYLTGLYFDSLAARPFRFQTSLSVTPNEENVIITRTLPFVADTVAGAIWIRSSHYRYTNKKIIPNDQNHCPKATQPRMSIDPSGVLCSRSGKPRSLPDTSACCRFP